MEILRESSTFGISMTLVVYLLSVRLYKRTRIGLLHPLLISQIVLIGLLQYLNIGYQEYLNSGASIIASFLGPATVALAIPLYKQWKLLRSNALPIIMGIIVGSITGILSIFILSKLFGLDRMMNISLLPKSVTSPIAMDLSKLIGGIPSLTLLGVMTAGILGAVFGPKILKIFGVSEDIAVGIALGTASHGLGTARALEEGEVQGAMSGLSVGLTGLITALLLPLMVGILKGWM